jgi:hypothetical protein
METAIRKAEEELENIERKYHLATRNVEIARQACDVEMCRVRIKMNCFCFRHKYLCVYRVAI